MIISPPTMSIIEIQRHRDNRAIVLAKIDHVLTNKDITPALEIIMTNETRTLKIIITLINSIKVPTTEETLTNRTRTLETKGTLTNKTGVLVIEDTLTNKTRTLQTHRELDKVLEVIHQTILEIQAETHQEVEVDKTQALQTEAMVHQIHQEEMGDVRDTAEMVVHHAEATQVPPTATHQAAVADDVDADADTIIIV